MSKSNPRIGLALSGGGSRAIAFHLGCMRALNDLGVLNKVEVLSTVSGGSVIGSIYAYSDCSFEEFEGSVKRLLSSGLSVGIARYTFFSTETPKIIISLIVSGLLALIARAVSLGVGLLGFLGIKSSWLSRATKLIQTPVRRFASRTTAFRKYLDQKYFVNISISDVARNNLNVIINATELKTQTAFRLSLIHISEPTRPY